MLAAAVDRPAPASRRVTQIGLLSEFAATNFRRSPFQPRAAVHGILATCPCRRPAIPASPAAASRRSWPFAGLPIGRHRVPAPSHTRLIHSRLIRSHLPWRDPLPVVLKLPDLTRGQNDPPPVTPVGSTRPWIGIAMWCATGALAVLAAVLIFTGRPESAPPVDEAPAWQPGPPQTAATNHSPAAGTDGGAALSAQPTDGAAPTPGASPQQATDGTNATPSGPFPWRDREHSGQPADPAAAGNDAAAGNVPPTGGLPPSNTPGNTIPGNAFPSDATPGGTGPARRIPRARVRRAGCVNQPSLPADRPVLAIREAPEAPPPDQSKLQTGLRTAVRPNAAGGARLGGEIRNLDVSPRNDSSR